MRHRVAVTGEGAPGTYLPAGSPSVEAGSVETLIRERAAALGIGAADAAAAGRVIERLRAAGAARAEMVVYADEDAFIYLGDYADRGLYEDKDVVEETSVWGADGGRLWPGLSEDEVYVLMDVLVRVGAHDYATDGRFVLDLTPGRPATMRKEAWVKLDMPDRVEEPLGENAVVVDVASRLAMLGAPQPPAERSSRAEGRMDERARNLLRTPDDFRAWLDASEDEYVGVVVNPASCPLARYLADRGVEGPQVFPRHLAVGEAGTMMPLAGWARRFIGLIDTYGSEPQSRLPRAEAVIRLQRAIDRVP